MAKQVHWQLPFRAIDETEYRIDIYDETSSETAGNSGWPVQLVGGATPFTTDESNNDDFFAPVRSHTGRINIIDEDGTMMESIMPSDNVDKPVRLIRVSDGEVMWQGFLSCEAYNQEYTARPNEVTLNVNSVLEAMKSVKLEEGMADFTTVGNAIKDAIAIMDKKNGNITEYYLPINSIGITSKYIDRSVMFDLKQQDNEDTSTFELVGMDLGSVISIICTYMGWTMRERGSAIYFVDSSNQVGYRKLVRQRSITPEGEVIVSYMPDTTQAYPAYTQQIEYLNYAGTGHQIEYMKGAKSVEVVAKVPKYILDMQLPECPVGSLVEDNTRTIRQVSNTGDWLYPPKKVKILANSNPNFNSLCVFNYYSIDFEEKATAPSDFAGAYNDTIVHEGSRGGSWDVIDDHKDVGAFMAKLGFGEIEDEPVNIELNNGLYLSGNAYIPTMSSQFRPNLPLFQMSNKKQFAAYNGFLTIDIAAISFASGDNRLFAEGSTQLDSLCVALSFGNKWWNGEHWQSEQTTFRISIQNGKNISNYVPAMGIKETGSYLLEIDERMSGDVTIIVYSLLDGGYIDKTLTAQTYTTEMFIKTLNVGYLSVNSDQKSDRSENHYYRLLDLNFADEVSVSTDIASNLNNNPSPAILMNSDNDPLTTLNYSKPGGVVVEERPEKMLLARLADYFGCVRRKITLEVEGLQTPIPLTRIIGYPDTNGARKLYDILSESIDWRTGVRRMQCFETVI